MIRYLIAFAPLAILWVIGAAMVAWSMGDIGCFYAICIAPVVFGLGVGLFLGLMTWISYWIDDYSVRRGSDD